MTKQIGYTQENISRIEIDNGISAGIRWGAIGQDMIPLYEEHSARIEMKYTLNDWSALDEMERALIIAVRRIDLASKNQQAEAERKDALKKAKSARKR